MLTALPIIALWYFLSKDEEFAQFSDYLLGLNLPGAITLSIVFLFLYSQVIRSASKYFQAKYFQNANGFPTTYLMRYSDQTYSDEYKSIYRRKVRKKFGIDLLDREAEATDSARARKLLDEAGGLVLNEVREQGLISKHNTWYGFFRNLVGGSTIGLPLCVVNVLLGVLLLKESILSLFSLILGIGYASCLISSRSLLFQHGEAFARQVISEFLRD